MSIYKSRTTPDHLESLNGIGDAAIVAGSTARNPWEMVLLSAATDGAAHGILEYAVTEKLGAVQLADALNATNSSQTIGLPAPAASAAVCYGQERIVLSTGMSAADAAAALGCLNASRGVNVAATVCLRAVVPDFALDLDADVLPAVFPTG